MNYRRNKQTNPGEADAGCLAPLPVKKKKKSSSVNNSIYNKYISAIVPFSHTSSVLKPHTRSRSQYQDLHCSQPWFHGRMKEGRHMAERLILDYCAEMGGGDGTFLVRDSDAYPTDFTLSFWYDGTF